MKYYKKITGKKVYLSPICMDDAHKYAEWLNDVDIYKYLLVSPQIIGIESEKEALVRLMKGKIFAIIDSEKDLLIGNCGLHDVDSIHKTCELGIFIGDKDYHGKGYGTEAIKLLLDFAFNVLNLNNVMLKLYEYNQRGYKSYLKSGFQVIGRRRKAIFFGGKYHDEIFMDILADEFKGEYFRNAID
ncbi:MAG: GNAT family N-acetyltransferase [Candidatus Delongbacteria bacterium]|nr:GNAT family N-acetyltransferase [Candidatus Delongbacteria bacterium]MBN2834842.1 GNAT family N-acetyltransferase [Candidatus Delongbacteria bacterium]